MLSAKDKPDSAHQTKEAQNAQQVVIAITCLLGWCVKPYAQCRTEMHGLRRQSTFQIDIMLALSPGCSMASWLFYVFCWPLPTNMVGSVVLQKGAGGAHAKCLWRVLRPLLDPKEVMKVGLQAMCFLRPPDGRLITTPVSGRLKVTHLFPLLLHPELSWHLFSTPGPEPSSHVAQWSPSSLLWWYCLLSVCLFACVCVWLIEHELKACWDKTEMPSSGDALYMHTQDEKENENISII